MSETKVVAIVEGKEITEADVLNFLNEIGPEVAMQFQSPEGIKKIVEEMVNQELLLLDAKANKFNEEEEFRTVMARTEDNLLKSYAFQKAIGTETVSDEEVENYFNTFKSSFAQDSADASHILVDSEEKANEILAEINEGLDFAEAAQKYSSCPSKEAGGRLGNFSRGMMVPEFEEAAFNMEVGAISEPVKTQFGYHIINITAKNEEGESSFDEVKEDLSRHLLGVKQQDLYIKETNKLKEKYNVVINM